MKILYIGHAHRINDPRLLHREMKLLHSQLHSVEFWFLKYERVNQDSVGSEDGDPFIRVSQEVISGIIVNYIVVHGTHPSPFGLIGQLFGFVHTPIVNAIARFFGDRKIDVVQASDVREIRFATRLGKRLRSKLIYDSHEDYVRQVLDYQDGVFKKYVWAGLFYCLELQYIRQFDHVFCTDEYLLEKYQGLAYAARSVTLLRNFPVMMANSDRHPLYRDTHKLRLLYIGGVNQYRGIIETAGYVYRFNQRMNTKKLEFTIYSPDHDIVQALVTKYDIKHVSWMNYEELMAELGHYDVGTCLWLPIKKFCRNLPLKNFDYMSQGLPIITSNFGNLEKYINVSGAGICINPKSYHEFEQAIVPMFDGSYRRQLGEKGREWVQREGNFETEGRPYVDAIAGLSPSTTGDIPLASSSVKSLKA